MPKKLLECYGIQQNYQHIYTCCINHSHSQHIPVLYINDIVIIKIVDEIRYAPDRGARCPWQPEQSDNIRSLPKQPLHPLHYTPRG